MPAVFANPIDGDDVAVSTSAEILHTGSDLAGDPEPELLVVQNNTSTQVTVGGPGVTDGGNGVVLSEGDSVTVPIRRPGFKVYAVAAGATTVQVFRA